MNARFEMQKGTVPLPSQNYQLLMQMINGYQISQMIHVVAKLGIADLISNGPKKITELAESTGVNTLSLYRLLRALASMGVFAEDNQGFFGMTPLAEPLRSGLTDSARDWAVFHW